MHTYSSDQALFIAGKGIIATETRQEVISVGDIAHMPAEEKHWHGATPDSSFSHIALTPEGSTTTQVKSKSPHKARDDGFNGLLSLARTLFLRKSSLFWGKTSD